MHHSAKKNTKKQREHIFQMTKTAQKQAFELDHQIQPVTTFKSSQKATPNNVVFFCTKYTFLFSFLNIHQIIFMFQIDISLLVDFDDHNKKKHHSIPFKIIFSFIFYLYYFMTTTYLPKSK